MFFCPYCNHIFFTGTRATWCPSCERRISTRQPVRNSAAPGNGHYRLQVVKPDGSLGYVDVPDGLLTLNSAGAVIRNDVGLDIVGNETDLEPLNLPQITYGTQDAPVLNRQAGSVLPSVDSDGSRLEPLQLPQISYERAEATVLNRATESVSRSYDVDGSELEPLNLPQM